MKGPFELFKHAAGHLQGAGDTDRRLALIGFDQTIEVCIEVYIRLHPRLREGVEIDREDSAKALKSFHSKIEFLEKHFRGRGAPLRVSFEAIVWYHSLRNELYHSGNGMIPELHVIEGAKEMAAIVFESVFGVGCLGEDRPGKGQSAEEPLFAATQGVAPEMDYLQAFVRSEEVLRNALRRKGVEPIPQTTFSGLCSELKNAYGHTIITPDEQSIFLGALVARDGVVYGGLAEMKDLPTPRQVFAVAAGLEERIARQDLA
jgi:hypothetical protein